MSDERPNHKRSKSALALSILHRDKSRADEIDEDTTGGTGSDAASETGSPVNSTHYHNPTSLRSSRHKHHGSVHTKEESPNLQTLNMSPVSPTQTRDAGPNQGPSLEESVKEWRLSKIFSSGDNAALTRAIKETSSTSRTGRSSGKDGNGSALAPLEGTTILHLAIQCAEHGSVAQILHVAATTPDISLDLNGRDRNGNTPLHLAVKLGQPNTVELLLAQPHINDSIVNNQGRSPLDFARSSEITDQLQSARRKIVKDKIREVQALVARAGYQDLEKLLEDPQVENTLDVNRIELATENGTVESGGTLLHEAAHKKDLQLIQILLLHGADPFRRDRRGRLPQDVTKDEKTRNILKKSPAAAAAQRGIQEKAVLGSKAHLGADATPGGKEGREMKGYLKKWTNYKSGNRLRWFVLEDGVMSYYIHEDDAGSACRGAIYMKIAKLHMDAHDKTKFEIQGEIQGKSSIKWFLKANHVVEAKRWFWALNNAIQWTKDEAKEEEKQKQHSVESLRGTSPKAQQGATDGTRGYRVTDSSKNSSKSSAAATTFRDSVSKSSSRVAFQDAATEQASVVSGKEAPTSASIIKFDNSIEPYQGEITDIPGDVEDEDEYGDDVSSHELQPAIKDAFGITARSASLQLDLLAQVSAALHAESIKGSQATLSDPTVAEAILACQSAVQGLQGLMGDMLRVARDSDAYWQDRLDREANMRRMWEDSMAKVIMEQEELEGRIVESEDKRKRTKRALRDALEGASVASTRPGSPQHLPETVSFSEAVEHAHQSKDILGMPRRKSIGATRRRSTITEMTNLSDLDSEDDEEFFDAVDAGEIEIGELPPTLPSPPAETMNVNEIGSLDLRESKRAEIVSSFEGYEDPVRQNLGLEIDDRPRVSLWGILKSMIGKDMTKMTLPVTFNEPTSLLQRVCEDMEYTELLDTAADRADSTERMLYVAAFAASEYASTIGRVAKPFNPLLGETYEYVRPDKGYRFFIEQVSHHPPVGAAWAESPKWDYYGESAVKSKFYGKSFDINPLGTWFLKLRPASGGEELYTWKKVTTSVVGIITGNPTVDNYGPMEIKNHTTGETGFLDFKPRGWKASSAYQVSGKVMTADGKTRWSIGGRWNDKIYARLTPGFEDADLTPSKPIQRTGTDQAFLVWEAHPRPDRIPFNLTPFAVTFQSLPKRLQPLIPPTDTRLRPDQRAMEDGQYDRAAQEKVRLEEKQRTKRRVREVEGVEWKPRWFTKGQCSVTGEEYWITTGEYWKARHGVATGGTWKGVEDIF